MKTLIIYTSATGHTKKYTEWLVERTGAQALVLEEAKKKSDDYFAQYDTIIYGGWIMAGKVVKGDWFFKKASAWKDKKLAVFCVGASPKESTELAEAMTKIVPDEQKAYIKLFYCQGGLDYEKMKFFPKIVMKLFAFMLNHKKNPTDETKEMAKLVKHSYDISDIAFIEPIVEFVEN